ncbi:hypothetical protein KY343_05015 [Candidatus Woesearchaeota archaeon]|nr:hypothetical protein [Candidatus Woesearchaeota archaeon]
MNPTEYIQKYGGKAGGFFFLRDLGGFEKHLPPLLTYVGKDEEYSEDQVPEYFPKAIVRGSHKNDHLGLVDIIKTLYTGDNFNLGGSIERIREHANSPEVISYNNYEGQEYDGKISILVQLFNQGTRGSMIEHPHKRGLYLVDFVDSTVLGDRVIDNYVVDQEKMIYEVNPSLLNITEDIIHEVIKLYKKVRESGFIPEDYTFQMEFGLNRESFTEEKELVLFYQARPFKKFEEPTFELDKHWKYNCYGMTPEEGIVLPVAKTDHQVGVNDIKEPFAWIVENITHKMSPHCQPRNMKAFLPIGGRVDSLEHNTYRWIRKADISITSPYIEAKLRSFKTGDKIRIRSNGICFEIKKE